MSSDSSTVFASSYAQLGPSTNPPSAAPHATLASPAVLSLPPINTLCGRDELAGYWDQSSFSPSLCLPPVPSPAPGDTTVPNSLLFTFQAQAAGFLEVALSPAADFVVGSTYQVTFGGAANMKAVAKRRTAAGPAFVSERPARTCEAGSWISYWVAYKEGRLMMGVNDEGESEAALPEGFAGATAADPVFRGENTLLEADDTMYDSLRPAQDRVKFVGLGNFAGLGFKNTSNPRSVKVRGAALRYLTEADTFAPARAESAPIFLVKPKVVEGAAAPFGYEQTKALFEEWSAECERQRARAEKFGHDYAVPALETFLKWSEAKRMRTGPQASGFITGIDTTSAEEEAKKKARHERFERDRKRELAKKRGRDPDDEMADLEEEKEGEEGDAAAADGVLGIDRPLDDRINTRRPPEDLPPHMAYTSEGWLRKYVRERTRGAERSAKETVPACGGSGGASEASAKNDARLRRKRGRRRGWRGPRS